MARDIHHFVLACSVCSVYKSSNRTPCWTPSAVVSSFETLVPHFARFCFGSPTLTGKHGGFDRGGPVLEGNSFHPLPKLPSAREQQLLSLTTFFAYMASRWTWSLTGGLSLFPNFGESFVNYGATVSLSSGFIPRVTVRRRGPSGFRMNVVMFGFSELLLLEPATLMG